MNSQFKNGSPWRAKYINYGIILSYCASSNDKLLFFIHLSNFEVFVTVKMKQLYGALFMIETKKAKHRYCNTERFLYFDIWPSAYVCFIIKAVFPNFQHIYKVYGKIVHHILHTFLPCISARFSGLFEIHLQNSFSSGWSSQDVSLQLKNTF